MQNIQWLQANGVAQVISVEAGVLYATVWQKDMKGYRDAHLINVFLQQVLLREVGLFFTLNHFYENNFTQWIFEAFLSMGMRTRLLVRIRANGSGQSRFQHVRQKPVGSQ